MSPVCCKYASLRREGALVQHNLAPPEFTEMRAAKGINEEGLLFLSKR